MINSRCTPGSFDDRLLMMTDTTIACRVDYYFQFANFEEKISGILQWMSKLFGVKRSYRNKVMLLYLLQIKPLSGLSCSYVPMVLVPGISCGEIK